MHCMRPREQAETRLVSGKGSRTSSIDKRSIIRLNNIAREKGEVMKKILSITLILGLIVGSFIASGPAVTQVSAAEGVREVEIVDLEGTASIKKDGEVRWLPASKGDILRAGDTVRTDPMSNLKLNFDASGETAVVNVSENAELTLDKLTLDRATNTKETILGLAIGSVLIRASKLEDESKFEVSTPTSIVGVRGTTFEVRVSAAE